MTRQQRFDRARRVQQQHEQMRKPEFGRKPYRCSQEQLANRRAAIGGALLFVVLLVCAFAFDQPVLALGAFISLTGAVLIARHG